MKILYHHRTRSKDGQSVHIDEMIGALRELGHEVILVAPTGDEKQQFGADDKTIVFLKRYIPQFFYELMELAYNLIAYRDLVRAIKLHRPDCIYERYNLFLLAGIWAKRRYRLPLLLEVNSPLFEERHRYNGLSLKKIARWSQSTIWHAADLTLPVTEVMAAVVYSYGVPREKAVIIQNGINLNDFDASRSSESMKATLGLKNKLVLGFTGFIRQWHGLDKVIALIATDSPESNRHLLVVGDGPERQNLEQQAKLLHIESKVSFTGMVERNQIPGYLAAFDIALQPAVVAYASPLKLIEYLAMGKAIVAPYQPNICELLNDEHNALLFHADQPNSMAIAINRLCQDQHLRHRLSRNAKNTINEKQLTWHANAQQVVRLFDGLIRHA